MMLLIPTLISMCLPIVAVCNGSKYGYTISNLFWIAPLCYFLMNSPRRTGWKTLIWLPFTGFLLDIFFASRFFVFENKESVLGMNVGGYNFATNGFDDPIPIEEFVFYFFGFAYTLFSYLFFCDLIPFSPMVIPKILRFESRNSKLISICLLLILSCLIKYAMYAHVRQEEPETWIPEYFWFIVLFGFRPVIYRSNELKKRIHMGAFLLTLFSVLVISIVWEVTLAIPQRWWGYRKDPMMGIFISPWGDLPLESVIVWICVTFTTVFVYESLEGKDRIKS